MARAYGWNAKLLIAEESTYGTLSDGKYTQVPFASSTIDSEQGLISSNVLGLGRDPTTPFQDVINVGGELAVPVDLRNIGIWLKAIFGTPTTAEDGSAFTHTFESGKVSLPSYTLEVGLPEVPEFIRFLGVKADSIAFNFARSGEAQVTVSLLAQGETASNTTIAASPDVLSYTRFSQFQGFIKSEGKALANITSASVTYSNNLEKIEITIRSQGFVFRAEEASEDFATSVDRAIDALERQIRKNKTRLQKKIRTEGFELIGAELTDIEEEEYDSIKVKTFPFKPMDVEEAILQMNLLGHDFYVFKDASTLETCVVYKRNAGGYGLIVPEI